MKFKSVKHTLMNPSCAVPLPVFGSIPRGLLVTRKEIKFVDYFHSNNGIQYFRLVLRIFTFCVQ